VKYSKVIALSLAILAIGVTIYYYITNNPTEITQSPNQYILNTQINSEGLVTIEVTPKNLSESAETWDFEIVLDTHSGNLEQDLTETSILIDDKGNKFNPIILTISKFPGFFKHLLICPPLQNAKATYIRLPLEQG